MNRRLSNSTLALVAAVVVLASATLYLLVRPAPAGPAPADPIPRLANTPHPDLSGVWQALNEANWDLEAHGQRKGRALHPGTQLAPGHPLGSVGNPVPAASILALGATASIPGSLGVVEDGEIPYTPEALAQKQDNFEHQLARDPEVKCLLPGIPRATYLPYPFEITQSHTKVQMAYGFTNAGRTIHLDEVDDFGLEAWLGGHNVGHWEGDTLVVTVTNMHGNWLDRAGNFYSSEVRVTERFTPESPNHMTYEATIEDPATFTRPWTIRMPLYRRLEENARVFEFRCVELVEELIYGHLRERQLVESWEADYGARGGTLEMRIIRKPTNEEQSWLAR